MNPDLPTMFEALVHAGLQISEHSLRALHIVSLKNLSLESENAWIIVK